MKKILSILMILVLVGGVAFAQAAPGFKGDATLSWGIDLGAGKDAKAQHGFHNTASASVTLPFVMKGVSRGEGDVYAFIEFSDVLLGLKADMEGSNAVGYVSGVSAKVFIRGLYITVYDQPEFAANKAIGWLPLRAWKAAGRGLHNWFNPYFKGFGTKIGYQNSNLLDLDVGLKLASDGNWKGERSDGKSLTGDPDAKPPVPPAPRANSQYAIGFDVAMAPVKDLITMDATVNAVFDKEKYVTADSMYGKMLNFGIGVNATPIKDLSIGVGFDGAAVEEFAWDAGLNANYKWVDAALYFGGKHKYADNKDFNMSAHVGFNSMGDIVNNLDLALIVNAYNLLSKPADNYTIPLGMYANVAYKIEIDPVMSVKPYVSIWGETNNTVKDATKPAFALAYAVGATFIPLEKLQVEAAWEHGSAAYYSYEGGFLKNHLISSPVGVHNGKFVLSAKITY